MFPMRCGACSLLDFCALLTINFLTLVPMCSYVVTALLEVAISIREIPHRSIFHISGWLRHGRYLIVSEQQKVGWQAYVRFAPANLAAYMQPAMLQ